QNVGLRTETLLHVRDCIEAHLVTRAAATPPAVQRDVRIQIAAGAAVEDDRRRTLHYLGGSGIRARRLIHDVPGDTEAEKQVGGTHLGTRVVAGAVRVAGTDVPTLHTALDLGVHAPDHCPAQGT